MGSFCLTKHERIFHQISYCLDENGILKHHITEEYLTEERLSSIKEVKKSSITENKIYLNYN